MLRNALFQVHWFVGITVGIVIFPLHSGRYFGMAGVIVFMMASLAMPLFAITGWMLYLARRRRKKRGRVHVPGDPGLATGAPSAASTSSIQ